ncbi:carboxypeptidase-like regulatory domain-containing protein [Poritiphilus flavus]|uniref:Carboxypeptidase-like regulatory domain-containing protein n=1 Tax=Poritiphilus flavus TaxID=2697053 RepID=A0A6L9EG14_9FLAO|nr:carboxypeptidase-like regulatory domain-containing protein [Poritiphilus flavus]NAS13458.1 hypothetical protein [Poritiphilus flavus]
MTLPLAAQKDYKGFLYDTASGEPIPYANIGVLNRGVGTVSDEAGLFHLPLDPSEYAASDTLQISSLGYRTIKKAVSDLVFQYNEYPKIAMVPVAVELQEVVLTNRVLYEFEDIIGYKNVGEKMFGYWKDDIALGGELATKIKIRKEPHRLDELTFEIWDNRSDSVLIRVNFYKPDGERGFPKTNINGSGKNIYHLIKGKSSVALIDLRPYKLFVEGPFILSLELIKVYGNKPISLVLPASAQGKYTHSYKKYASQDEWKLLENTAMAYTLKCTRYSEKEKRRTRIGKVQNERRKEKQISGMVFFANKPLEGVLVTNLETSTTVTTNAQGRFSISGKKGDKISFESSGKQKLFIELDKTFTINIQMERDLGSN